MMNIPPEVLSALVTAAVTLLIAFLHQRGNNVPILSAILKALGGVSPAPPARRPNSATATSWPRSSRSCKLSRRARPSRDRVYRDLQKPPTLLPATWAAFRGLNHVVQNCVHGNNAMVAHSEPRD